MLITLNGNPLDISGIDENVTVLELVELVEESLKGCGTTVMRILLDGKAYSADNTVALEKLKLIDYSKAEMIAESVADVVREAFEDSMEILLHLEDVALEVSSELRLGNIKKAMGRHLELINGFLWFSTIIKEADKAYASKMAETAYENERQILLKRIKEQVGIAEMAQASEDWVGVADVIEYEFCEIFRQGRDLIANLMKE